MNESVRVPVEAGKKSRVVLLTVREKSLCRVCGQEILRVSNKEIDTWLHAKRVEGIGVDHSARPNGGHK